MFFLIGIVLIGFGLFGCAANGSEPITSLEQLGEPGRKIGVPGDLLEFDTLQRDYPKAEVLAYNDKPLAYEDVANGRLDAFVYARREMEFALANGTKGVRLLDENYSLHARLLSRFSLRFFQMLQKNWQCVGMYQSLGDLSLLQKLVDFCGR